MASYILLMNFTDQGIRKIKDTPKRAMPKTWRKSAEQP
jgi:uncharacterized protein with GYD domain